MDVNVTISPETTSVTSDGAVVCGEESEVEVEVVLELEVVLVLELELELVLEEELELLVELLELGSESGSERPFNNPEAEDADAEVEAEEDGAELVLDDVEEIDAGALLVVLDD